MDLATGIIANDGFGGRDVIKGAYEGGFESRGTDNTDVIMGGHRDERFIGRGGDDQIFADGVAADYYGSYAANPCIRRRWTAHPMSQGTPTGQAVWPQASGRC